MTDMLVGEGKMPKVKEITATMAMALALADEHGGELVAYSEFKYGRNGNFPIVAKAMEPRP